MASQKTASEFLTIVDLYIRVKIIKAEEAASQFTSQNDVSICLKESYTFYIIPSLIGIRKNIEETLEESKINNYNATQALFLLVYFISKRAKGVKKIQETCTDPIKSAGLSLVQGIYVDVLEEIDQLALRNLNDNENKEKSIQELEQTPLNNPINETNQTPVSTYDSSAVANQYRQDIVKNNVPVSDSNKQQIPQSENSSQLVTKIIPILEIIIFPIISILFLQDKNPIIAGMGDGFIIVSFIRFISLFKNTKPEAKEFTELNFSTNFTIIDKPELLNILIIQSPARYIFLCIITGGLYIYYWFYKNWFFLKKLQKLNIIPALCGAFSVITIYSLSKRIFAIAKETRYLIRTIPFYLLFMQICMIKAIGNISGIPGLIPLLFAFYPTIYIYDSLTYYAKKTHFNYQEIGFFSGGMIGWIIFGIITWSLRIIGSYN